MTASFDHYIVAWDYEALLVRIKEKALMREEDIASRRQEVYQRFLEDKKRAATNRRR